MTLVHVQSHPRVLKAATVMKTDCKLEGSSGIVSMLKSLQKPQVRKSSYHDENWLQIGGVLGHRIHAKISPKAASEKAQTTGSKNRYTNLIIDFFGQSLYRF